MQSTTTARQQASTRRPDRPRVIVADDDALARRTVRDALQDAGVVVVAEASTGKEAVELALHYRPDVVVMDLVMPSVDGIAATRKLARCAPEIRVLVVTLAPDPDLGMLALRVGADGYLQKDSEIERLPEVVRDVAAGIPALTPELTSRMIHRLRELPEVGTGLRPVFSPLSRREWEVIDRLSAGDNADKIAEDFVLSPETIRTHIKNILRKLGVHSQAEAIAEAARMRGAVVSPTGTPDVAAVGAAAGGGISRRFAAPAALAPEH